VIFIPNQYVLYITDIGLKNINKELQDYKLWCLTPLSTIFQLYRGDQLY
jgi:hypothetical protein